MQAEPELVVMRGNRGRGGRPERGGYPERGNYHGRGDNFGKGRKCYSCGKPYEGRDHRCYYYSSFHFALGGLVNGNLFYVRGSLQGREEVLAG